MVKTLEDKVIGLGGYFKYYISDDERFFIKVCREQPELIKKEYMNLKKYWNNLNIKNLQMVEPIKYSEEKALLITRYINSKTLDRILNPRLYLSFGQKLKIFHMKGFTHGHLDFTDVLYENYIFYIIDVPYLNRGSPINDLASLKLSLNMFKLKRPSLWRQYNKCYKSFLYGYKIDDEQSFQIQYNKTVSNRVNFLLNRKDILSKLKGLFLFVVSKLKLI